MAHTVAVTFTAFFMLFAGAMAEEAALKFEVLPSEVISGETQAMSIDCRTTGVISDLKRAFMMDILLESENGTSQIASQFSSTKLRQDGRTKGDGKFQSEENKEASFLSVTITEPSFGDQGVYKCRFIYINTAYQVNQLKSTANVTVEASGPPHADPPAVAGALSAPAPVPANPEPQTEEPKASEGGQVVVPVGPQASSECQVAFSVNYKTQHGQPILSDHHLLFNDVTSNKGEAYDLESGFFTAPCDGQYFFTLTLRSQQEMDSGYVDGLIIADDEEKARTSVFIDSPINNIESATNSVILTLKQGAKVNVLLKTTSFGQIMGATYTMFSGYFLFH